LTNVRTLRADRHEVQVAVGLPFLTPPATTIAFSVVPVPAKASSMDTGLHPKFVVAVGVEIDEAELDEGCEVPGELLCVGLAPWRPPGRSR
jgi:hypothetical protein